MRLTHWFRQAPYSTNIIPLVILVICGFITLILLLSRLHAEQLADLAEVVDIGELESQKMRLNSELMEVARKRYRLTSKLIDTRDPFEQDEINMQLENEAGSFASLRQQLLQLELNAQESAILEQQGKVVETILPASRQAIELAMNGEDADDLRARQILFDVVFPGQTRMLDLFSQLISLEQKRIEQLARKSYLSVEKSQQHTSLLIMIGLISIILLSAIVIWRIRNTQQDLLESHRNLETQVQQRTGELRKAQSMLTSVLNTIPVRVFWKDQQGHYLGANTLYAKDAGYLSADKMIGTTDDEMPWGARADQYREEDLAVINSGKPKLNYTAKIMGLAGKTMRMEINKVPLLDDDQRIIGVLGTSQDVSARHAAEEKLKSAISRAEQANQAKSEFLATMSHEIRTPMNAVLGMAQLLEDTELSDEQKDYLNTIKHSGNGLLSIINDILDFSKLEADRCQLERISFNLERVCQESMELVAGNSKRQSIEFLFDYDPDCPRYFLGDPSRIRQIMINLLGNAVKFTEQGYIRLGLDYQAEPQQLRIDIEDTGIGIQEHALEHLFDKFTQADQTTTRIYGGTGLGLAITHKLVRLMQGDIEVTSNFGKGSTFSVRLPLPVADAPTNVTRNLQQSPRILFVDDNEKFRDIFAPMLRHMGADVTMLANADQVMDHLSQALDTKPYQITILDQNMAGTNVLQLGEQIRRDPRLDPLKMMIFSAAGEKGDSAEYARIGFDAYLSKLCRYEVLQSMLSMMLLHKPGQPIITQHSIEESLQSAQSNDQLFQANVLLVEDMLPNQIIARKILSKIGAEVDIAGNGQEAVELFQQRNYDLVLMDCRMPIMDGYQATEIMRRQEAQQAAGRHVPIIALTANSSKEERELCIEAGMDDVVTKPFKQADIANCLQRWLTTPVEPLDISSVG